MRLKTLKLVVDILLAYLLLTLIFTFIVHWFAPSHMVSKDRINYHPSLYHIEDNCVVMDYNDNVALLAPPYPPDNSVRIITYNVGIQYYGDSADTCAGRTIERNGDSIISDGNEIRPGDTKTSSYFGPNIFNPWFIDNDYYSVSNLGRFKCFDMGNIPNYENQRSNDLDFIFVQYQCTNKESFNIPLLFVLVFLFWVREKLKTKIMDIREPKYEARQKYEI
ncbi:hypothetical protein J7J26_03595 [Candidatus Micrarchaeota archaeon]|nr:hypothetical protein [Candidatus Micrarchaeota archaeon]